MTPTPEGHAAPPNTALLTARLPVPDLKLIHDAEDAITALRRRYDGARLERGAMVLAWLTTAEHALGHARSHMAGGVTTLPPPEPLPREDEHGFAPTPRPGQAAGIGTGVQLPPDGVARTTTLTGLQDRLPVVTGPDGRTLVGQGHPLPEARCECGHVLGVHDGRCRGTDCECHGFQAVMRVAPGWAQQGAQAHVRAECSE